MNIQELKTESEDMALRALSGQMHSHRMELYHTNQVCENSRREQAWLQAELENRERAQQETRIETLQEAEELKRTCCTEAERTQKLRMKELSRQKLQESSLQ